MQTGYVLISFMLPIFLEGCCVGDLQSKRLGFQQNTEHQHYRAVEGEFFMMPCFKSVNLEWSRIGEGREANDGRSLQCGRGFLAEATLSGKYTSLTRSLLSSGSNLFFHLQVVGKNSLRCFHPEESSATLLVGVGGKLQCPGLNCSNNTGVIWYKGNKAVSDQHRASCEKNGLLQLCQVWKEDTGVYFCDRHIIELGVKWTFRRAVNVTVVPHKKPSYPPRIIYPINNTFVEVELGKSHTLTCEVIIPFEMKTKLVVQWYMHYGGNVETSTLLHMENSTSKGVTFSESNVTQGTIIKEVTAQHLNNTYTCIAKNTVGNNSVTIRLKKKIKATESVLDLVSVKWQSLVGYPIASFLLVTGLGIVLHVKRLELKLIYRSHFQYGIQDGDEKEFDVFVSHVWSPSSEVEGVLTLSSQSRPDPDEEACLSSMGQEEGKDSMRPLELLLPQVLEDLWGYRVCLLERDILPGGAYTNDVVLAIQRSRMLICFLSADYLSNSNAVFVLESGVQALLQNSSLKLLLIWTSRVSSSLIHQDPPLPTLVQRALKVLPSLNWTGGKPARATRNFWKSLRKAMPHHRQ